MAHIEPVGDEFLREMFEQFGIRRRVACADVVERLDDPRAGEIAPEAVHIARGKIAVVRRSHPRRELLAPRAARLGLGGVGELGRGDLVRPQMRDFTLGLVADDFVKRTRFFHLGARDFSTAASRVGHQRDLREKRGRVVILILRPALEGMVVALVAVEARGEEKVRRVFHCLHRIMQDFPVARRRVLFVRSARGEDFSHELIVGRGGLDLLANPLAEKPRALLAEKF